jgi:prepilin-type N-terminal cleavage/methylation domain-containing protein
VTREPADKTTTAVKFGFKTLLLNCVFPLIVPDMIKMPISRYSGFTLVELVVVIVVLGILGTVALGKFEDLSDDTV